MRKGTINNTVKIFSGLLLLVILFHLGILLKVIPYHIAWGGRLTNDQEMYVFETISILLNMFLGWIVLMKGKVVRLRFSGTTLNIILWVFFGIFILNTVGNLFAETGLEKSFALLTGVFALLIWNILKCGKKHTQNETD